VEVERCGGGENFGLTARLLRLDLAIGSLALHDDADAGERRQGDRPRRWPGLWPSGREGVRTFASAPATPAAGEGVKRIASQR
jgi:hypothetical protein